MNSSNIPNKDRQSKRKHLSFKSSFALLLATAVLFALIGAPSQLTIAGASNGSKTSQFKIVKLPYKNGRVQVWCRVGKTVHQVGKMLTVKRKASFTRYNSREMSFLKRSKAGKKIIASCDKQKFPSAEPNVIALPTVPTAVPTLGPNLCADGIDNDGDGLIDADDPDCWVNGSRNESPSRTPLKTYAVAWSKTATGPENLAGAVRFGTWLANDIEYFKTELAKLPEGQHALLFQFDETFSQMTNDPDDYCTGKNGAPNFSCLYWDKGAARLAGIMDTFFAKLKNAGVKVDYLLLDFEGGLSVWHLNLWDEASFRNYMDPAMQDSRWPPVRDALTKIGFADVSMPFNILDPGYNHLSYQQWAAVMGERISQYVNTAVFAPAKKYYPNVTGSNFGSRECNSAYQLPEANGHIECQFNSTATIGGEQNVVLYGSLGNIRWLNWREINSYPETPFSALRYDMNWVKSAKLSGNKPLSAWIAYREFATFYHTRDRMSEITLQALSGGVERLLAWNPHPWDSSQNPSDWASDASDTETADAIKEFDTVTAGYKIQYEVPDMESWNTHIVSSCMMLENAGRVCRVTADPDCTDFNKTETASGVTVTACGQQRTFSSVRPWSGSSLAPLGFWLVPKHT